MLDDNDSLGEDYKNCLLSVLNRWENILLNKNEADYLIPEGYADNSIKETLEDSNDFGYEAKKSEGECFGIPRRRLQLSGEQFRWSKESRRDSCCDNR